MQGVLRAGNLAFPCMLGRSGIRTMKREGDGATPRGAWRLLGGFTRLGLVRSTVALRPVRRDMGWCDAPDSPRYNQLVRLPFAQSREELWRSDNLYDIVIVLDHNSKPRLRNGGSAVFFHLTGEERTPTAGCIAISLMDMRKLLPCLNRRCGLVVH